MTATLEAVATLLTSQVGNVATPIAADTSLADDLGMDSLDKVEFEMLCEDTFSFRFTDDQGGFGNCKTVGDVHAIVIAEQAKSKESVEL